MLPMTFRMLAAAAELYGEEGPEGVSLRKLARRLDVSPSALYRHFSSRAELLDCIAGHRFAALGYYLVRHRDVKPARARLRAVTPDALDFALGNQRLFKLMFDETRRPGVVTQVPVRYVANVIRDVMREEPAKILDPANPGQIALAWLSLIMGAAALHRAGFFDEEALRNMCSRAAARLFGIN